MTRSTAYPDDDETKSNTTRFVETALGGDGGERDDVGSSETSSETKTPTSDGLEKTPLVAFGRWLMSRLRAATRTIDAGSGSSAFNPFAAVARLLARLARAVFETLVTLVLRRLLGERETFDCPLVTVSDVIDAHGLSDVGLLKVDVERAELDVLRGVREEHWPLVRQVAMEVHDGGGEGVASTSSASLASSAAGASASSASKKTQTGKRRTTVADAAAPSTAGRLEEVTSLLVNKGGFDPRRIFVEQHAGLEGSTLWNVYATRAEGYDVASSYDGA